MQNIVDDKVKCPATYTAPASYYGYVGKSGFNWMSCRDTLNSVMNCSVVTHILAYDLDLAKKQSQYFQVIDGTPTNYARCIHFLESHLDLYSRSTVHTTSVNNVVLVQPSIFWYTAPLRLSFFTIFTRAAVRATANLRDNDPLPSMNAILDQDIYFSRTWHSTSRFMSRCTYLPYFLTYGWFDFFTNYSPELCNPREFSHDCWLTKVQAMMTVLCDDNWQKAEYLCGLAACVG